jgi:hypothetical protein
MAAPLIGVRKPTHLSFGTNTLHKMGRSEFERIQKRAKQQLDNKKDPTAYDIETMALQIAWLNWRYRDKRVYFALLGAPERDIAAFPPHDVDEGFLFYQHRGGIWSVAHITRHEPKDEVLMFDGISSLAPPAHDDEEWRIRDDEQRNERIDCLTDVVKTWLKGMSRCINIPFWDRGKFSDRDRDSTLSARCASHGRRRGLRIGLHI